MDQGGDQVFQLFQLKSAPFLKFFLLLRAVRLQIDGKAGFQGGQRRFQLMGDVCDKGFGMVLFLRQNFRF